MRHDRSTPPHIQWVLLPLVALWLDLPRTWAVEAPKPMRALIVFDISGSMRQSDPQRLSVAAARLFVDLAQPRDALGGKRRRSEEPALLAHILRVLLPQYRQRRIALYTIAFTAEADQALLQEMAQATGGEFRFIANAGTLHNAFSQLFTLARQSESFPLNQGSFVIDTSIQDVALVFGKHTPQEYIGLVTPRHAVVDARNTPAGTTWQATPSYDLVQMTQPEPGTWQIERSSGVQEGVGIVGTSTLGLHVALSPTYREAGEPISIHASLADKGQPVREAQQVQGLTVHATITTPQGETTTFVLTPHSVEACAATLPPLHMTGQYRLVVMATSPTFQRQRTLSFTLHPRCFHGAVSYADPVADPVMAHLVLSDACPPFEALAIEAERTTDSPSTTRIALTSPRAGVFEAAIPSLAAGQTGQVTLHIHAHPKGQDPFILVQGPWPLSVPVTPGAPPPSPPPTPSKDSGHNDAAGAVRKLLVLNGLLVLAGGVGYGLYRYRSRHKKAPPASNADVAQ